MSQPTSREEQRDRLLEAALVHVPFDGWSRRALFAGAADLGLEPGVARRLFPRAGDDMLAHLERWADRQMLARVGPLDGLRVRERIAKLVRTRLEVLDQPSRGDAPRDGGPPAAEQCARGMCQPVAHGRPDVGRRPATMPATPATTASVRCWLRSGPAPSCSGSTIVPKAAPAPGRSSSAASTTSCRSAGSAAVSTMSCMVSTRLNPLAARR